MMKQVQIYLSLIFTLFLESFILKPFCENILEIKIKITHKFYGFQLKAFIKGGSILVIRVMF